MTEEVIVRASSLSGYPDCPRRGAARMHRRLIEAMGFTLRDPARSIGASVGSAVHDAAATMLKHKAMHGELSPASTTDEQAIEVLRGSVTPGILFDRETPELNTAEQQVIRMARVYRVQVAPQINPMLVEERLEAEVRPGLILSGMSDVTAREPGKLHDTKAGKRMGNHGPQVGGYGMLNRSHGYNIVSACINFIQRVSMKKPQPDAVEVDIPLAHAETAATSIIHRIHRDRMTFENGDARLRILPGDPWAFMANPSSMLCSRKWCEAFGTDFCREHAVETKDEE